MSLKDANLVNAKKPKRIAIVISNPAVSPTTGWPVGFWWSELTHPYFAFTEKGYEIEIFSPNGGICEPDAMSDPRDPSGYSSSDLISWYATFHAGLVAREDIPRGRALFRRGLISPSLYLVSIGFAFVYPPAAIAIQIIVPVLFFFPGASVKADGVVIEKVKS